MAVFGGTQMLQTGPDYSWAACSEWRSTKHIGLGECQRCPPSDIPLGFSELKVKASLNMKESTIVWKLKSISVHSSS